MFEICVNPEIIYSASFPSAANIITSPVFNSFSLAYFTPIAISLSYFGKERFQPLVLWGCSRDMAYDAQCEGCRSFYLYELIMEFADITPFLDRIEKNLIHSMYSSGWEFAQDCNLLAFFVSDRNKRAWRILTHCYDTLLQILSKKRTKKRDGLFLERDNFE